MSSHQTAKEAEPGSGVNFDHPAEKDFRLIIEDRQKAIVTAKPKRDKVAIVGFATSSRSLAPFDDPSYEIWTLNQLYRHVPRTTRHFDIHKNWDEENVEGTDHRGWIREAPIPVYMMEAHDDLPSTVRFPIERILDDLGVDYFTSSVAFEVALAMNEGFKEIALYGIDLIVGGEYFEQKANLEFVLGVAHGRGINVRIPQQSALLKHSHRYGYQREPEWGPCSLMEVGKRIDYLGEQANKQMALINALDGAIGEYERLGKLNGNAPNPEERKVTLVEQRTQAMTTLSTVDGALQEATYWRDLYTLRGRGAVVNHM
jgi:hypothetical protein